MGQEGAFAYPAEDGERKSTEVVFLIFNPVVILVMTERYSISTAAFNLYPVFVAKTCAGCLF